MIPNNMMNCLQSVLYKICTIENVPVDSILISHFSVKYNTQSDTLQEYCIIPNEELIKSYLGLDYYKIDIIENLITILNADNGYIVVMSDAYECKWTPGYKRVHNKHFFIIKKIIQEQKLRVFFSDPYYGIDDSFSCRSYHDLQQIMKIIFYFKNVHNYRTFSVQQYQETLRNSLSINIINREYQKFIEYIETSQFMDKLTDQNNINNNGMILDINDIIKMYKGIFLYLDSNYSRPNVSNFIANNIENYNHLKLFLMKRILSGNKDVNFNNKMKESIHRICVNDCNYFKLITQNI